MGSKRLCMRASEWKQMESTAQRNYQQLRDRNQAGNPLGPSF